MRAYNHGREYLDMSVSFMNATDHTGDQPCSPNLTQTLRGFKTRVCLPRYCCWIFFFSVCESQIASFGIHVRSAWFRNISQSSFHRLRPWQWKLTRTLLRTLVFSVFRSGIELFFFSSMFFHCAGISVFLNLISL